ncbi:MAG: MFS transporter [Candidatus Aramenus sulfurataquae]|jgi:MFS family permease|uniref:MFS transporter n=3 Tax=Candidatus Aramenus sulfurataquae TaxID=1326980 RepID=A0AAE3FL36_9CREN|nr:MFS transporter [Candidatus Aramenus sulfurataquae]
MQPARALRILSVTSLAHFINDGTFLIYPLLIVYYSTELHVSVVFLGSLSIIYALLSGLLSPIIGNFADKHDLDAPLLALGIFLEAVAVVLFGASFALPSAVYYLSALGAVILGVGQAFYHPIGGAVLSRTFGKSSGRALGINGSMGSVGRAIMPSVVTLFILYFAESTGLFLVGAIMVIVTAIIYFGLRFYKRGSAEEIRKTKERLESRFVKFLIILGAIVFIRSMFITGVTTFTGQYIYQVYLSKELAGIFLTVGFIGSVFGQPLFGWMTERVGGRITFVVTSVLSIAFFLLFMVSSRDLILASLWYTLFTLSAFSAFPVLLGYVSQVFPRSFYTLANSYIWGIGNTVGGAMGNALITLLLGLNYTIFDSFYVMVGLAVLSTLLTPLIPKKV